jgi:death-on-curing family protein
LEKRLAVIEVELVAHKAAREAMTFDEPIPDFSTRIPNILESCLATPFQTYENKYLYRGFLLRAAMLFYLMIKNHPFENGNKRIAITTLLTFLYLNGKWIDVDTTQLYNLTIWVAESDARMKNETVAFIKKFLALYMKKPPAKKTT